MARVMLCQPWNFHDENIVHDDLANEWRSAPYSLVMLATLLRSKGHSVRVVDLIERAARLAVMASDAYFPFPDGIHMAAQAGVTAIIQPGGSIRDEMAIEVADRHHLAMVFTGRRHFRH